VVSRKCVESDIKLAPSLYERINVCMQTVHVAMVVILKVVFLPCGNQHKAFESSPRLQSNPLLFIISFKRHPTITEPDSECPSHQTPSTDYFFVSFGIAFVCAWQAGH